jgi:hypothetical protein
MGYFERFKTSEEEVTEDVLEIEREFKFKVETVSKTWL